LPNSIHPENVDSANWPQGKLNRYWGAFGKICDSFFWNHNWMIMGQDKKKNASGNWNWDNVSVLTASWW